MKGKHIVSRTYREKGPGCLQNPVDITFTGGGPRSACARTGLYLTTPPRPFSFLPGAANYCAHLLQTQLFNPVVFKVFFFFNFFFFLVLIKEVSNLVFS